MSKQLTIQEVLEIQEAQDKTFCGMKDFGTDKRAAIREGKPVLMGWVKGYVDGVDITEKANRNTGELQIQACATGDFILVNVDGSRKFHTNRMYFPRATAERLKSYIRAAGDGSSIGFVVECYVVENPDENAPVAHMYDVRWPAHTAENRQAKLSEVLGSKLLRLADETKAAAKTKAA